MPDSCSSFQAAFSSPARRSTALHRRVIASILALLGIASISILQADGVPELPRPTAEQAAWQDDELGMFIHFDIEVFDKAYQYALPRGSDRKPMGDISPSEFNPRRLDTDQWLRTARALGAKYAVFTAKHESGFLMWQSDLYPFGVKQSPWQNGKGDVVREFVNSCSKYGIQPGLICRRGVRCYESMPDIFPEQFNLLTDWIIVTTNAFDASTHAGLGLLEQMFNVLCAQIRLIKEQPWLRLTNIHCPGANGWGWCRR